MAHSLIEHDVRNWTLPPMVLLPAPHLHSKRMRYLCWNHFSAEPVAAKTRWTPCRPHVGNVISDERTLAVVDDQRLVWKMPPEKFRNHTKLACFFLATLLTGIFLMSLIWSSPVLGFFIGFPMGAIVSLGSSLILWRVYSSRRPAVFDRDKGYSIGTPLHPISPAHHNSEEPQEPISGRPRRGNLDNIHAVQVISKFVKVAIVPEVSYGQTREPSLVERDFSQSNKPTRSKMKTKNIQTYELNSVLKSGARVSVIDHDDAALIREDASTLATFLKVPVWDDSDRGFWRFLLTEKMSFKLFWLWTIRRAAPGAWLFLPGQWKGRFRIPPKDTKWELGFAYLQDHVELNGHARIRESDQSFDYFFGPFPLGKWVAQQRVDLESLSADQRNRLEILTERETNQ